MPKLKLVKVNSPEAYRGHKGVLDEQGGIVYLEPRDDGSISRTLDKGVVEFYEFRAGLPASRLELEELVYNRDRAIVPPSAGRTREVL